MSPVRILVVEDEGAVGRDIQNTLVRFGYSVPDIARTGSEALEIVRRVDPDLVLMDIRLSGSMDGIETAERIRASYAKPVIYLTALADEATMARASRTEPEGYLLKPFNATELKSAVELAISRARSREALENREEQFMSTLRSMADGVVATDIVGNITFMNPVAESLTGWKFSDARKRVLQDVLTLTDHAGREAAPFAPRGAGGGMPEGPGRRIFLTTKSGEKIAIEDNSAPLKDSHGSLVGLVVVFRRAEPGDKVTSEAPDEGGESLRGIVEGIADPLIAVDRAGKISYANTLAAERFGEKDGGLLGHEFWEFVPAEVRDENHHDVENALARRERHTFEFSSGDDLWYEASAYPFGDGLLILLRDITDRRAKQEHDSRIEKLESLGLLARGFAHDFNNILTVVLGNLSLAEMKLPEDIDAREELQQVRAATLRAQGRVQQLLTFAKGGAPIRERLDPAKLITEIDADLERIAGITYKLDIARDLWPLEVDSGQFRRVVENLVRNSEQAMADGGRLTVSLRNAPAGSPLRESLPESMELEAPADYVLLQVEDSGHGVDSEIAEHLFEPYFSTRGEANATGIGLTVCESIARAHQGGIGIESERGRGTVVSVAFPAPQDRAPLPVSDTKIDPTAPARPTREKPLILVLEDEALIRQLLVANLRHGGYEVVETEDGVETVARYIEAFDRGEPFDMVITDLSIPNGMGGVKAVEEIHGIDPDVIAIVSSGYSDDPAMADPKKYGFSAVLPKPYQPKQLLETVAGLLENKG